MGEFIDRFKESLETGFIDQEQNSEILYQPKLLVNSQEPKKKVLTSLLQEFQTCESFFISVAFVTTGGVATIINTLQELEQQNIKGKIVVSQYLNFTQPEALRRLLQFKNVELRIATNVNAHSKGYLFKKENHYNLIVGSSNLTQSALSRNKEWNLQVSALKNSKIILEVYQEFQNDFDTATLVSEKYIAEYEKEYQRKKIILSNAEDEVETLDVVKPNQMQLAALDNLNKFRSNNKAKALIISATGTGKTFLSAFDAKAFNPNKLLFVVHRLSIAEKAMSTFKKVFGGTKSMGLYSGNKTEVEKDFLFSTVQTISRENHLYKFEINHFDYIIIDESHRSGAQSYINLINYFKPKFLLGMTATPERTDGFDIFKLFDHNVAYEIRLNDAMEEQMLCPFHYYGVSDLFIDDEEQDDHSLFNRLTSNERVNRIVEKIKFYGTDNGICRGLIFTSRVKEARELSIAFNKLGFKTIALSGEDKNDISSGIDLLESTDESKRIDYIFTVNIFNEGIDIPKVNQIIMLRPTESAIIFVQQLGRGLRKENSKSYLTVIDFIGNHNNSYLIPIALYGDTSYNKDRIRKLLSGGSTDIPGVSTINFDKITKERIFKSIDSANMSLLRDLKKDYSLLKYRLGRIPLMMDFVNSNSRDPFTFVKYSKSYYNFVVRAEEDFDQILDKNFQENLNIFSLEINNGKRVEESILLNELLEKDILKMSELKKIIFNKYNYETASETIESVISNLNFKFIRKKKKTVFLENNLIKRDADLSSMLKNLEFKKYLKDAIDYSIQTYDSNFSIDTYNKGFLRYQKYSRKDVCRLLNWESDISSTLYGYRTREGSTPCFVTYHKADHIDDSINYNDHFITPSLFAWESRSNRKIDSSEIQNVIKSKRILLFIKKADSEGTDFYYMGDVDIVQDSIVQAKMLDSDKPVVHFKFKLDKPAPENLYNYITDRYKDDLTRRTKIEPIKNVPSIIEKTYRIPLYNLYAAAGSFSELQTSKEFTEIEVPERFHKEGYFAFKVIGESMNRRIPNGSICIFKHPVVGSRTGKILLIEYFSKQDQDMNSHFTVKTYSSSKIVREDGWRHEKIILKPNSNKPHYEDIIITQDDVEEKQFTIVGEFVDILEIDEIIL